MKGHGPTACAPSFGHYISDNAHYVISHPRDWRCDPCHDGSMSERPLVIVDIDGVLADVTHRQHHLEGSRRDWSAFFAAAAEDSLITAGAQAVLDAAARGESVAYLTGRPERLRSVTESWLTGHGLPVDSELLVMRPDRDRRPARLFKVQAVRLLAAAHTIQAVWDDDPQVVDAVRSAGFPAELVAWATPRAGAVAEAQETFGIT